MISPYYTDPNTNRTVDKWLVKETGRLFRLKTFTANVTGSFQSKKTTGNGNSAYQSNGLYQPWYQDQYFGNRTDYVNFELPWRMNFDYSLTLNKSFSSGQDTLIITHSSNFNVDFSLTPKWQIQASMRVNWTDLEINTASIRINRDLHCWYLFMEWYPIGRQFVNFGVRVKASQLGFLNKLEKSIPPNSNVFSPGF